MHDCGVSAVWAWATPEQRGLRAFLQVLTEFQSGGNPESLQGLLPEVQQLLASEGGRGQPLQGREGHPEALPTIQRQVSAPAASHSAPSHPPQSCWKKFSGSLFICLFGIFFFHHSIKNVTR